MRHILILFITLFTCLSAYSAERGGTFEKDGVVYTIASIYAVRDTLNSGEVYVSSINVSDVDLVIPAQVAIKLDAGTKAATNYKFNVAGVEENAFEGAKLKNLVLPHNMRFVGKEAFKNMEITDGVFFMPEARRILANAFYGLKAKLFLLNMGGSKYEDTFQDKEHLPEIYVMHDHYSMGASGLDKTTIYTVGQKIANGWLPKGDMAKKMSAVTVYLDEKTVFKTLGQNTASPTFNVRKARKYDKVGTNLDLLPPYEYSCFNTYTGQSEVYTDFRMNSVMYRVKKDNEYLYFTLDGKPITDKTSVVNAKGLDPFGLQLYSSAAELKAAKAQKKKK